MVEALDIALDTGELDKRVKGVVRATRELLSPVASGQTLERNPYCWVYLVNDVGPGGEQLTKECESRYVLRPL
jgi:hypothetical protein